MEPSLDFAEPRRILYINSYHSGFIWSDGIERGFRNRLRASKVATQLYSEYVDARRFPSLDYLDSLAEAFAKKYKNIRCDVVAVSDNAAFDFAVKYREKIFPGVPIVFCGYNGFTPSVLDGIPNITGVSETVDYRGTIDMALSIHPGTKTLVFISSTFSSSSTKILSAAESELADYRKRYRIVLLKDLPMAELKQQLARLPADNLVFIMGEATDLNERKFYPVEDYSREVAAACPVPIYSMWDFYLDTGVMGGSILTGPDQGQAMAELALQILAGTPASRIPVITRTSTSRLVDFNAMQRFGISKRALPPGTFIFNKPLSFYERYRSHIGITAAVFTVMSGIVLILSFLLHRSKVFQEELRRSEETLREEQEKLSLAITAADLGTWVYDLQTDNLDFSPRNKAMLGLRPDAKLTMASFLEAVHPEDRARIQEAIDQSFQGKDYHVEHRAVWHDGSVHWIAAHGKTICDCDGRPNRFMGTAQDITEQKEAEAKLARVTQLYAALSQCNQAIVHAANLEELLPKVCRDVVKFGGMTMAWIGMLDEATGRVHPVASFGSGIEYLDGIEISVDSEKPSGRGPVGTSIRENRPSWFQDFQNDPRSAAWHERAALYGWAAVASLPLSLKGKPIGCLGIYSGKSHAFDEEERKLLIEMASDINFALDNFARETERKEAEAALRESEARFKSMFNEAPLGIAVVDSVNGRFYSVNPTFAKIAGRTVEEMMNIDWMSITHPDDVQGDLDKMALMNAGKITGFQMEKRYLRPDGTHVWINMTIAPMYVEDKAHPRHLLMIEEITERKRMEDALRQAKETAETANQAKDQFIAVLSHELRTPLTPVLATLSAMDVSKDIPAEIRADMEVVRRNVQLEADLVNDLLDITSISRKKTELRYEVVDSHACLQTTLDICRNDIEAKHLGVSISLQAPRHHVWADPVRLRQVFWNLLKNAVKFTPDGGRIMLATSNVGEQLRIEVADTGIGIEPDVMPRIFDIFEQGEQTKLRRFGGLGLGLHIAKTVVELHKGTLTAFSEGKNKGASFTVELSTVAPSHKPLPPPASISLPSHKANNIRVLLVDDHPDTLYVISRLMEKWGYTVRIADSVRMSLDLARQEPFDVLVSDIGLPDGSGLDIMRQTKELYGLRGIALSGFGTEFDLQQSRSAGFEEHLTKPIAIDALRAAIERIATGNSVPPQS